jgi:hypothetical protein
MCVIIILPFVAAAVIRQAASAEIFSSSHVKTWIKVREGLEKNMERNLMERGLMCKSGI